MDREQLVTKTGAGQKPADRGRVLLSVLLLVVAGAAVYANSLHCPFMFDDDEAIAHNNYLRRLWPLTEAMKGPPQSSVAGRPIVSLTLAINYAMGKLEVRGYHVMNVMIHLAAGLALFGVAAPSFWLGLVLLYVFGYLVPILPLGGPGGLTHLILPAITLGLAGGAWYARMLRSSMLDVLHTDYVRTARAKGLTENDVLLRHALRNAIQPIVTMVGMDLGYYLGGIVLIEAVFSWPGIGYEMWQAIGNLDIPVIVGTITFAAVAIVVMNFIVDMLYSVIDPRVRLGNQ